MPSKSGGPIIIDGSGSVTIKFDDNYYKPGSDPDDHQADGTKLGLAQITTSGGVVDLSSLLKGDLTKCRLEISHKKPKGTVTIKAMPIRVNFSGKAFKKNQHPTVPKWYFNKESTIESVDFYYDGGSLSFDKKAVGKGKVQVDEATTQQRTRRRRAR